MAPVHPPHHLPPHRRPPPPISTLRAALPCCAAVVSLCLSPCAATAAPPLAAEVDLDPVDLLVDGAGPGDDSGAGSLTVGVEALVQLSSEDRTAFGAFAFLQVPFARLAAPARRTLLPAQLPDRLALAAVADPPRPEPGAGAEAEADPPEAAPAVLLSPDLARGAVRAACKAAKLDEGEARLDALASRARTSALLPELRLRATRAVDESESLSPTEYDPLRRTASGGTSTWFEARATFRLDRLVFADDELAVERLRLSRAAERARLVAKVLELLSAWQSARAAEVDPAAKPDVRVRATLAATASEAALDVLTGGWFSKAIGGHPGTSSTGAGTGDDRATSTRDAPAVRDETTGEDAPPTRDVAAVRDGTSGDDAPLTRNAPGVRDETTGERTTSGDRATSTRGGATGGSARPARGSSGERTTSMHDGATLHAGTSGDRATSTRGGATGGSARPARGSSGEANAAERSAAGSSAGAAPSSGAKPPGAARRAARTPRLAAPP